ncbi:MAG: cyclic pyranopterin monophosphate synthase MoaC [Gluconacetobacter diazotrophicus]|nr:cyclic pyranopterin monophosphate synthase MoaC [Gluconacetobacter diazotrophicus]
MRRRCCGRCARTRWTGAWRGDERRDHARCAGPDLRQRPSGGAGEGPCRAAGRAEAAGAGDARVDPGLRAGAAGAHRSARGRTDCGDEAALAIGGRDPGRVRPGGAGTGVRGRRRCLPVGADRAALLRRPSGGPARGARGNRTAGAAQGLHPRPVAGLREPGDGCGLHPADHGGAVRRGGAGAKRAGAVAGAGRAGGSPRRRRAAPGAGTGRGAGGHQQPQPAHAALRPGGDGGAGAHGAAGPHRGVRERHQDPGGPGTDVARRGVLLPGRREPAAAAGRGCRLCGAGGAAGLSGALTHLDAAGRARMVDVGDKPETPRVAVAGARIMLRPETLRLIEAGGVAKGDVWAAARIAGIMAAKRTWELIPLCHPIPLEAVTVAFEPGTDGASVEVRAEARTTGRTGVEMEAMTAASVAALCIYDMCKAVDRGMRVDNLRLVRKSGGRSGVFDAEHPRDGTGTE